MYFNDWQLSCFYWTFPNVSSYSSSPLHGNVLFGNLFCLIISNTSTLLQYLTTLHSITSSTIMLLLLLLPRKRSTIFNNIAFHHLFCNIAAVTVPPIEMQAALHSAIFEDIAFHCLLYCCSFPPFQKHLNNMNENKKTKKGRTQAQVQPIIWNEIIREGQEQEMMAMMNKRRMTTMMIQNLVKVVDLPPCCTQVIMMRVLKSEMKMAWMNQITILISLPPPSHLLWYESYGWIQRWW